MDVEFLAASRAHHPTEIFTTVDESNIGRCLSLDFLSFWSDPLEQRNGTLLSIFCWHKIGRFRNNDDPIITHTFRQGGFYAPSIASSFKSDSGAVKEGPPAKSSPQISWAMRKLSGISV